MFSLSVQGIPFLGAIPTANWGTTEYLHFNNMKAEGLWDPKHGDRHSRLVIIGVNMNKPLIERKLKEALLTPTEDKALGGVKGWRLLPDGECSRARVLMCVHACIFHSIVPSSYPVQ